MNYRYGGRNVSAGHGRAGGHKVAIQLNLTSNDSGRIPPDLLILWSWGVRCGSLLELFQLLFVVTKLVDETVFLYQAKPSSVCNVSGEVVYRLVANWPKLGSCESASEEAPRFSCLRPRPSVTWRDFDLSILFLSSSGHFLLAKPYSAKEPPSGPKITLVLPADFFP